MNEQGEGNGERVLSARNPSPEDRSKKNGGYAIRKKIAKKREKPRADRLSYKKQKIQKSAT